MHIPTHVLAKIRAISSRLGSLLLLFQRTPVVQMLFPEARLLSSAGVGEITTWAVATVVGLGAYDSVAGATTIKQLAPEFDSTSVTTAVGANLSFVFQLTNYTKTPGSWTVTGFPNGLVHADAKSNTIDSLSGIPTQTGTFTVKTKAWHNSNYSGDSFTANFTMIVGSAIISNHPQDVLIASGDTANLSVSAGSGASYQWYQGNSPNTGNLLNNKTSASFTTPTLTGTTRYWVRVTKNGIVSDSTTAIVSIGTAPNITTHPAISTTINSGGAATLSIAASGTSPTIQWYRGASGNTTIPIANATSLSFTTPSLTTNTSYWAKVTNALGSDNSNTASIAIRIPPAITTQPAPTTTINSGGSVTLTTAASGTSPTFQWYAGISGNTSTPVAGETLSTFNMPSLTASRNYWVRASNLAGSADSTTASITVLDTFSVWQNSTFTVGQLANPAISGPTADPDGDGIANQNEYIFGLLPLSSDVSPSPVTSLFSNQISLSFIAKAASGTGYVGLARRYSLESADALNSVIWSAVLGYTEIIGSNQTVTYSTATNATRRFYRLSVRLAP